MGHQLVEQILHSYGVVPNAVLSTQKGYRNESHPIVLDDGSRANFILYKSEPGIKEKIQNANRVSNFLAGQGFPTRRTIDDRTIKVASALRTKYGALYNYLPGETIPWEAYTRDHIKQLGKIMSDIHAALLAMPRPPQNHVADEYIAIAKRMEKYFSDPHVQAAMREKLGLALGVRILHPQPKLLEATKHMPGQQTLHMDFVRGNILFTGKTITGILDFEKTAYGRPEFDIARTLAFLLVDCKYKDAAKVRKYFLHSGYQKRGQAAFTNPALLDKLLNLFLIYDFYKFLRHNPYEYLHQNEHFVRTQHILERKGLVLSV